jgi:hypothetical protein
MSQICVSIADTTPKGSLGAFVSKRGEHSRPKEISLFSGTLGRNLVLTWSQPHDQNSNRCCCSAAVGLSFAQLELGQSNTPDFNALNDRSARMACGPSRGNRIILR